jgi:prevent-host-death family protein
MRRRRARGVDAQTNPQQRKQLTLSKTPVQTMRLTAGGRREENLGVLRLRKALAYRELTARATCRTMAAMKEAGIREARQNLSALIAEVQKGREIMITDRGKPVARLVPPLHAKSKPFIDHSAFRRSMPRLKPSLSQSIVEDREDRL